MSLLASAFAADGGAAASGAGARIEQIAIVAIFLLFFYFFIFRPQSKRAKEQKKLMNALAKGEEVLTSGGLVGKIAKISADSDYVVLALNDQNSITIKKDFITAVLPKGTIQSL